MNHKHLMTEVSNNSRTLKLLISKETEKDAQPLNRAYSPMPTF